MSTAKLGPNLSATEELDALRAALEVRLAASEHMTSATPEARFEPGSHDVEKGRVIGVELRTELEAVLMEMETARITAAAHESVAEEARAALRAERLNSATLRRMVLDAQRRIRALEQELASLRVKRDADVATPAAPEQRADRELSAPPLHAPAPALVIQPLRGASRQPFHEQIQVRVDGEAALLVDLSVRGAQVVSDNALKPNRAVKILLPVAERAIACKGQVVWARLEPTSAPGSLRCRAGMLFTSVDESAIEGFMTRDLSLAPPLSLSPPSPQGAPS